MHNYKIDNNTSSMVLSSFEEYNDHGEIISLIELIGNKMLSLGIVDGDKSENCSRKFSELKINNVNAFSDEELNEYLQFDVEIHSIIDSIKFEIDFYTRQKKVALENFDIAKAVKLSDKINTLNLEFQNKNSAINRCNKEIADIENIFQDKYYEFVLKYEENKDDPLLLKELEKSYNMEIVKKYKVNELFDFIDKKLNDLEVSQKEKILHNEKFKSLLGVYYESFLKRIGYVGADS